MDEHAYQVRQGGLMRCCLGSLDSALHELAMNDLPVPSVGTVIGCFHCKERMIKAEDGVWEWDHPFTRP